MILFFAVLVTSLATPCPLATPISRVTSVIARFAVGFAPTPTWNVTWTRISGSKLKRSYPVHSAQQVWSQDQSDLISFFLVKSRFQNCYRATGTKCFPKDTVRSIVKKQTEEYCISDLTWCLVVFTQKSHLKTHLEVHARNPARVPPASAANQIDPSSVANRQASLLINKVNKNNSLGLQTASITNPGKQSQQMQSCLMGLQ